LIGCGPIAGVRLSLQRLSAEHLGLRSCYLVDMKRKIVGYHTDAENHWVAELECGHGQHVRDDPPWRERPWVRTAEGRASRLGHELNCVRCDEFARKVAEAVIKKCRESLVAAYEDAGTSGLCAEGAGKWLWIRSAPSLYPRLFVELRGARFRRHTAAPFPPRSGTSSVRRGASSSAS
jgi:hypothetical protein